MKISFWVYLSDLIRTKETLADKLGRIVIADEKHSMFKNQSIDEILSELKRSGVDGLELLVPSFISSKNIESVKNITSRHNLPILSIHQSNNNIYNLPLSEVQRLCCIANNFSANIVTLHCDAMGNNLFDKQYVLELKKLQKKYKLKFGIENMPKSPFSLFKSYAYNANKFPSVVNKPGLFMTFDTTHLAQVKGDICEFYRQNKQKIINIHLSDYRKSWLNRILLLANNTHLPLDEGELEIKKLLKILNKDNYAGLIAMEINANLSTLCRNASIIKKAFTHPAV